tara:strand:- start:57 stop:509 length:453 start_codon:yes stop_codon:yes gene_type:complete
LQIFIKSFFILVLNLYDINPYNIMAIKSLQTLVSEAMQEIKTISAHDALKMVEDNNCNLIDIRESNELESTGKVKNSVHIPRGKLEIYLDPNSALYQQGVLDKNKEIVLFCAGGVRSALAVKALKNMGYEKISHIEGGFGAISQSKFKIE